MKRCLIFLSSIALALACGGSPSERHGNHNQAAANDSPPSGPVEHHSPTSHVGTEHSTMKSSAGAESAPFELQFLDTMIAHHQAAVDMAMLAETRSQHAEVKELAHNIINEQEREIAKMSKWRDRWFPEKPAAVNMNFPGMEKGMRDMSMKKLEALNGHDFDIEFLRQMIPHHEGAIEMARAIRGTDSYAELKELAEDIITSQSAEIEQMRTWLTKWQSP